MNTWQTILIALIEGITEFLPISSTGHMVLVSSLLGIESSPLTKGFIVCIQFGAILAVVTLYLKRFFKNIDFYLKLFVGFLPIAIVGLLLKNEIDKFLESIVTVAIALIIGGVVLLFVDRWFTDREETETVSYGRAFRIGLFQCFGIIPGVSRSAATIIGGMAQKLTRRAAAEFSFFLAVPTMFAAGALKLYETSKYIKSDFVAQLILGNIVAYITALLTLKFFIDFLHKHGFKLFGIYRIVLGVVILLLFFMGKELSL